MSKPYGKPNRVVIALGGNALGNTPEEQIRRVREAAPTLLRVIEQGNEIIITHGNGPQVGMIQKAFTFANQTDPKIPTMDLPECGAMSQGYIGYHLQQAVVTQIEVDPDDPAFQNPTKPIGAFLTKEQADAEMAAHPDMTFVEDSGRGWRRVVASPDPKKIVEYESILNLLDNEFIVIACGGGGIPVVRDYGDKGAYKGVAAVIDKDMGGELLAEDCHADTLVLLTAVDYVAINFGKPDQKELEDLSVGEARAYLKEGQFGKGSMEPKGGRGHGRALRHPHPRIGPAVSRLALGVASLHVIVPVVEQDAATNATFDRVLERDDPRALVILDRPLDDERGAVPLYAGVAAREPVQHGLDGGGLVGEGLRVEPLALHDVGYRLVDGRHEAELGVGEGGDDVERDGLAREGLGADRDGAGYLDAAQVLP